MNVTVYAPTDIRFRAKLALEEAEREARERAEREESLRRESKVSALKRAVHIVFALDLDDLGWEWRDDQPLVIIDGLTFGASGDRLILFGGHHACGHFYNHNGTGWAPVSDLVELGQLLLRMENVCYPCEVGAKRGTDGQ